MGQPAGELVTVLRRIASHTKTLGRLLAAAAAVAQARRGFRRTVALAGLSGPVEVRRDRWGVPHVYAASDVDLYMVQGYLHGADRLWQMELQRRLGHGHLAELFGAAALGGDRLVRTLGLGRAAEDGVAQLNPEAARAVKAYVRGVNAAIRHEPRPLELRLLGVRPRPWTSADVLAWTATMALMLSENWTSEALRARLAGVLGEPCAPDEADTRLSRAWPGPHLSALADLAGANLLTGGGSNAWAVTGARTKSGAPLLASDPHLAVGVPGIWYENHLVAPGLEVTGAGLPGAPGVVIGHNAHIAWGITNGRVDAQDLYLEWCDGDRYLTRDGWEAVTSRQERIEVRDGAPHVEQVRASAHGPIVTAFLGAAPTRPDTEVALRWNGPAPAGTLNAIVALNRATDWQSFRSALDHWISPAQHVVYADVAGHVGTVLAGAVPRRAQGEGTLPLPGWTGAHEWTGELPRPGRIDPPEHLVVAANDRILDDTGVPLVGEWVSDYRALRIRELIQTTDKHDADSFARMQADLLSLPGLRLRALADRLPARNPVECAARAALSKWDGQLTADSVGGTIYWSLREALLRGAFADDGEALALNPGGGPLRWQPGRDFLEHAATPVVLDRFAAGDDAWLGGGRTWEAVAAQAWQTAVEQLTARLGPDVGEWRYGRLHEVTMRHPFGEAVPLLGKLLNRGPFPIGGDLDTVRAGHVATSSSGEPQFSAATYRMVCDLADWDAARSVLPTGQSGRPGHRHYLDQVPLWLHGELHPMPWSRDHVDAVTRSRTAFVPEESG